MARIGVIGSRGYPNLGFVRDFIRTLPLDAVIVSGGGGEVDRVAVSEARFLGMTYVEHLPKYELYGKAWAPRRRNIVLVEDVNELRAFWDGTSTGTRHALNYARSIGTPAWYWWNACWRRWP